MNNLLFVFTTMSLAASVSLQGKLVLAHDGKTDYTIVYDLNQDDPLVTPAVRDLSRFLEEMTQAPFPIATDAAGPKIFIGQIAPGDTREIQSRERRIRSVGQDIYIYGDYRYGTSGAIYNLLTSFCGCRFFTATGDNLIPRKPDLSFDAFDYSHVPSFVSMEHGSKWTQAVQTPDIRDWVRRNNSFIMPAYAFGEKADAWNYIGPVTHTLFAYFPPVKRKPRSFDSDGSFLAGPHPCLADKEYFKTNPEYFSLDASNNRTQWKQLCFSNPDVRRILTENLQKVITAEGYDTSKYAILDLTQNDRGGGFCACPDCTALAKKYGTPGGPYFDYLAEMGRHFGKLYPRLSFRFFAYQEDMTGIPPKGLTFPENVSPILAPIQQDWSKPFLHPRNTRFRNQIQEWGNLCKGLWLWNYPTIYPHGMIIYPLFPGIYRNTENMKFAYQAGVRHIIAEQGGSVVHACSFKELNVYLQNCLGEDINTDVDAAIKEFCDFCYGAAADDMINYLKETDAECRQDPAYFIYHFDARVMKQLHHPRNLARWQRAFDKMVELVRNDERALFNVNRARINLDAVSLLEYDKLSQFDPAFNTPDSLDKLYNRYCDNVKADTARQYKSLQGPACERFEKAQLAEFCNQGVKMSYLFHKCQHTYPQELLDKYGKENLVSVMPGQARIAPGYWGDDTPSGFAIRVPYTDQSFGVQHIRLEQKDGLPWLKYEFVPVKDSPLSPAKKEKYQANPGFHCYFVTNSKLTVNGNVIMVTLPRYNARFYTGYYYDPANPDQQYDIYVSLKDGGDGQSLLVDRLILAKLK